MNHSHRHVVVLALLLSFAVLAGPGVLPSQAADKHFVCGPCGQPCDSRVFDKPGSCPECGMALVEQGTGPVAPDARKKV